MNKIEPRNCIQILHREVDIGFRGDYELFLDKNEKIGDHEKNVIEELAVTNATIQGIKEE